MDQSYKELHSNDKGPQEPSLRGDLIDASESLLGTKVSLVSLQAADQTSRSLSLATATPSSVSRPFGNQNSTSRDADAQRVGLGISAAHISPKCLQIATDDHRAVLSPPLRGTRSYRQHQEREPISFRDGLCLVVLARLRCDRQTRDERIYPLLRANQIVSELQSPAVVSSDNQCQLLQEVTNHSGSRISQHHDIRLAFVDCFAKRQCRVSAKAHQLKEDYMALHQRWLEHCVRLDEEQKISTSEEPALPSGSRATRRTATCMGDAVRSDLEMEQIIASLGVEELTDPNYLALRNVAKIPDMVSVTDGHIPYLIDDTNNLVDNPAGFYGASSRSDYWTEEERIVFLREFAAHPKQFGLIAQRLPNKTAAQCVTYYYLHKKQGVDFRKAVMQYGAGRRRRSGKGAKQRGNALLADIRRHDDEVSRVSSGDAPNGIANGKRKRATNGSNGESRKALASRKGVTQPGITPVSSATTPDPDADPPRRRRRTVRALNGSTVDGVDNDAIVRHFLLQQIDVLRVRL